MSDDSKRLTTSIKNENRPKLPDELEQHFADADRRSAAVYTEREQLIAKLDNMLNEPVPEVIEEDITLVYTAPKPKPKKDES